MLTAWLGWQIPGALPGGFMTCYLSIFNKRLGWRQQFPLCFYSAAGRTVGFLDGGSLCSLLGEELGQSSVEGVGTS